MINPLKDIRGYLAHFELTCKYAFDFNYTENELIKLAIAFGII